MKTNEVLQKEVQDAIKWEPLLHAAEVGVIVKDGIVTLTGQVDNFAKKREAELAAKNVGGVKAVVDDIEVVIDKSLHRSDSDIAVAVTDALHNNWSVPDSKIKVTVDDGWVTLEGTLHWDYQRKAAKSAISHIQGVKGVLNRLNLQSKTADLLEKKKVDEALRRNWSIDSDKITVKADGNTITLTGAVSSLYQKDEAEKIAYKTPGVWMVNNYLEVEYDYSFV